MDPWEDAGGATRRLRGKIFEEAEAEEERERVMIVASPVMFPLFFRIYLFVSVLRYTYLSFLPVHCVLRL